MILGVRYIEVNTRTRKELKTKKIHDVWIENVQNWIDYRRNNED